MSRLVREFVEVAAHGSLDDLIEALAAVRESLPEGAEADIRMRGDDVFGRRLSVSYLRPQTAEEAACEARYADAHQQSRRRQLAELQAELDSADRDAADRISLAA